MSRYYCSSSLDHHPQSVMSLLDLDSYSAAALPADRGTDSHHLCHLIRSLATTKYGSMCCFQSLVPRHMQSPSISSRYDKRSLPRTQKRHSTHQSNFYLRLDTTPRGPIPSRSNHGPIPPSSCLSITEQRDRPACHAVMRKANEANVYYGFVVRAEREPVYFHWGVRLPITGRYHGPKQRTDRMFAGYCAWPLGSIKSGMLPFR